jgi:hypothetical protein
MGENKIDLVKAGQKDVDCIMWFTIGTSGEFPDCGGQKNC